MCWWLLVFHAVDGAAPCARPSGPPLPPLPTLPLTSPTRRHCRPALRNPHCTPTTGRLPRRTALSAGEPRPAALEPRRPVLLRLLPVPWPWATVCSLRRLSCQPSTVPIGSALQTNPGSHARDFRTRVHLCTIYEKRFFNDGSICFAMKDGWGSAGPPSPMSNNPPMSNNNPTQPTPNPTCCQQAHFLHWCQLQQKRRPPPALPSRKRTACLERLRTLATPSPLTGNFVRSSWPRRLLAGHASPLPPMRLQALPNDIVELVVEHLPGACVWYLPAHAIS